MIFRETGLSIFERRSCARARSGKPDSGFYETVMLKHSTSSSNPAAGRGQGALDYTKGWTPSEVQRPWQDRRMLISKCDQHLAILRMVFAFRGDRSFVKP
jgi:hypothetical protein